jgi:hypothetical protein
MIREKRGYVADDAGFPFPPSLHFHSAVGLKKQQDENAGSKKERQICARRRHHVVVRARSIEENEANLKEKTADIAICTLHT